MGAFRFIHYRNQEADFMLVFEGRLQEQVSVWRFNITVKEKRRRT